MRVERNDKIIRDVRFEAQSKLLTYIYATVKLIQMFRQSNLISWDLRLRLHLFKAQTETKDFLPQYWNQ